MEYTREALLQQTAIKNASQRVCTDCGKPTHNYRCERCWKKKRGYGFEDSGDKELVTGEARQRMLLNDAAAKQEKKEARGQDWFVPSAKYGKPPPAPPPGEQKCIAPAMPAKGHQRQWARPLYDGWMPKKRATKKKESPMPEQKKNWTIKELAAEAGLSDGCTYAVLSNWRRDKGWHSPSAIKLRAVLERHNLRWQDLGEPAKRRSEAEAAAATSAKAEETTTKGAPADERLEAGGAGRAAPIPEAGPGDMDKTAAAPEATAAAPEAEDGPDNSEVMGGDLTDDDEPDEQVIEISAPAFSPLRPDYGRDFCLSHVPMEALVVEITRRMPRAQVVLC